MREATRQRMLRAIGWRAAYQKQTGGVCRPVYVPIAVREAVAGAFTPASFEEAKMWGATGFAPSGDRITAKWPRC